MSAGQAFIYFNASRPRARVFASSGWNNSAPDECTVGEREREREKATQPAKPRRWVILIRKTAGVPLALSLCADEMLCVRALWVCPRAAFTKLYGCAPSAFARGLDLQFQSEKSTDCWGIFFCTEIYTWPASPLCRNQISDDYYQHSFSLFICSPILAIIFTSRTSLRNGNY